MALLECDCISGIPPFDRFIHIYAALFAVVSDDSLPSVECVRGEPYQDQVSRIYEAARIFAEDDSLLSVLCVRGRPIWQQWLEIYRALYIAAGEPEELTHPDCIAPMPSLQILSHVYCALVAACVIPVLESATINEDILTLQFSASVTGTTGLTLEIESAPSALTYTSGEGSSTLVFTTVPPGASTGDEVILSYTPGDISNGSCPLEEFSGFVVTNNTGVEFSYLRPGGAFTYFRPDGTSQYIRP